jgi:hypothetical protein
MDRGVRAPGRLRSPRKMFLSGCCCCCALSRSFVRWIFSVPASPRSLFSLNNLPASHVKTPLQFLPSSPLLQSQTATAVCNRLTRPQVPSLIQLLFIAGAVLKTRSSSVPSTVLPAVDYCLLEWSTSPCCCSLIRAAQIVSDAATMCFMVVVGQIGGDV